MTFIFRSAALPRTLTRARANRARPPLADRGNYRRCCRVLLPGGRNQPDAPAVGSGLAGIIILLRFLPAGPRYTVHQRAGRCSRYPAFLDFSVGGLLCRCPRIPARWPLPTELPAAMAATSIQWRARVGRAGSPHTAALCTGLLATSRRRATAKIGNSTRASAGGGSPSMRCNHAPAMEWAAGNFSISPSEADRLHSSARAGCPTGTARSSGRTASIQRTGRARGRVSVIPALFSAWRATPREATREAGARKGLRL